MVSEYRLLFRLSLSRGEKDSHLKYYGLVINVLTPNISSLMSVMLEILPLEIYPSFQLEGIVLY